VTLNVAASNVTSLQWMKNGANVTEGTGGNTTNYTTNVTASATYTVVLTNIVSACSITSNEALVTMVICCTAPNSTENFTAFKPCANVTTGAEWNLIDTRESNNQRTYKVKLMPDGHIWMVQDLKFGDKCNNRTSFKGSTFDMEDILSSLTKTYYGDCRNNAQSKSGHFYDWAAALNKSDAYRGSSSKIGCSGTSSGTSGTNPGACQGICPNGWHIPTGNTTGEFQALAKALKCPTNNDKCLNANSTWEGVYGGYCGSNFGNQGRVAYYWSSTFANNNNAYILYFSSGSIRPGNGTEGKNIGLSVRCVKNY
jgi:uncharacterized protein (TIGR02145 family)